MLKPAFRDAVFGPRSVRLDRNGCHSRAGGSRAGRWQFLSGGTMFDTQANIIQRLRNFTFIDRLDHLRWTSCLAVGVVLIKIFQILLNVVLGTILIIGILFFSYRLYVGDNVTNLEIFLSSVILTFLSVVCGGLLAKAQEGSANKEKIDAIAKQSSDKLANQSTHIFELEEYIKNILIEKNDDGGQIDNEDLSSIIQLLRTIRRNNTGLMQDWTGVASERVSNKIQELATAQNRGFDILSYRKSADDTSAESDLIALSQILDSLPPSARPMVRSRYEEKLVDQVEQNIENNATSSSAKGIIRAHINRPSPNFTSSGKINPYFGEIPTYMTAKLLSGPERMPKYEVKIGTGTVFDFSVHIKVLNKGEFLPEGDYEFEYELGHQGKLVGDQL